MYTLLQASANGHTYLPEEELRRRPPELLKVEPEAIEKHLMDMQMDKRLVVKNLDAAGQGVDGGGLPVPDAAEG